MIEIQFAVIVLLIAMTLILSRYYNTRFRALEDKMKDVADFQQSVKELAEAVQDLKDAVKSEKAVLPEPEEKEKTELTHPVVPVGQRPPAVVTARPMAVVEKTMKSSPSSWQLSPLMAIRRPLSALFVHRNAVINAIGKIGLWQPAWVA